VTFALARSLLLADAVTPTALAEALFLSATRGTSLVRALLAARAIDTLRLEQTLERGEAPYMRQIAPVLALVDRLPAGLCDRLLAMPVRQDPRTGTVDVAVVDARDPHPAEEIAHWLKAPVRMVRTSIASMESALLRLAQPGRSARTTRPGPHSGEATGEGEPDPGMRSLAPPIWAPAAGMIATELLRTPMYGLPAYRPPTIPSTPPPAGEDTDLAIPLTRRNFGGQEPGAGPPAVERRKGETEPILDLKRRKPAAPVSAMPPPARSTIPPPAQSAVPPPAPPPPARSAVPASVAEPMREARDRDQILDLLVMGTRSFARRAAVLAVRRDALAGWTCSLDMADLATLRSVHLMNAMPTVFHSAFEREGARLARIPMDAAHAALIGVMRSPPAGQVVIAAVHAEGKGVAVVFADGLSDPGAAIEQVGALVRAAGEALGRLLRERRSEPRKGSK
jgi:hypothetical protein